MKWAILLACLASWLFQPSPVLAADPFFEHSYAVVIGIDHYPSQMWPQLQYAGKDARAIKAFLDTQNYTEIITLYDHQATKQAIIAAMQNKLAPKLKTKDRVLVFFAGHGYTETLGGKDRGYIVPYDGGTQSAGYISMDELERLSDYMGNARHQLFIMDSCYGGLLAATRGSMVDPSIPDYLNNISDRVARQVVTAGGKNQEVLDGGPKGHSFFVDYLLEALADGKADTNGDGYITFGELDSYMTVRASNRQQTPMFSSLPGHQAGEYLFRSPLGRLAPVIAKSEPVGGTVRAAGTINSTGATEPGSRVPSPTIRKISVAVLDSQDHFIPNIQRSSFHVIEGGVSQPIVDFTNGGPATVALLVEYSSKVRTSSKAIVDIASLVIDVLGPTDWVSISSFDVKLKILCDFNQDHAFLHSALNQLQMPDSKVSNLFDSLADIETRMEAIKGRKAIVVIATGNDTFSKSNLDETRKAIRAAGTPIYAIRVEPIAWEGRDEGDSNLKAFAADTAGTAFSPGLDKQYTKAFIALRGAVDGYQISYQGSGLLDASNVKVQLVNPQTNEPLKILDQRGTEIRYRVFVTPIS